MKSSRLARRFNKKGRQQTKIAIEENPSANVLCFIDFFSLFIFLNTFILYMHCQSGHC